jgi:xylulokinase
MDLLKVESAERFLADIENAGLAADAIPVFTPYLTGERTPHDDPTASATFSNLRMGMGPLQLGRAVLEGVAFALADCQDALGDAGAPIERIVLIGGGARSRFWAQLIANAIDRPLAIPAQAALGPALGAARLARQAVGGALMPGETPISEVVTPDAAAQESLARRRTVYRAHYQGRKDGA